MNRFFKLSSLIVLTSFVVLGSKTALSGPSSFYEELRKMKSLDPASVESVRKRTFDQDSIAHAQKMSQEFHETQKQNAEKAKKDEKEAAAKQSATQTKGAASGATPPASAPGKTGSAGSTAGRPEKPHSAPVSTGGARLNLKEEDLPQELHFPEATPTPRKRR